MTPQELRRRTKEFSKAIVRFSRPMLAASDTRDIFRQLLRAGTSVGSNYRSAQRGRSHKEFRARLGVVLDEADESQFWLEIVIECELSTDPARYPLLREATELVSIFTRAYDTASERE